MPDHAKILGSRLRHWPDEAACAADAAAIARRLRAVPAAADAYVALEGGLGAGKTTFVRHLLRALGETGRVKSPTFAVHEPYRVAGIEVAHFDFYRFTDPREWLDAGFRDAFAAPGLKLAEWPQRAGTGLPEPDLRLAIGVASPPPAEGEPAREVRADAFTPRGLGWLAAWPEA